MSQKLYYSWDEFNNDVRKIADKVKKLDYDFQAILAISRGGLIPGVMLSHLLKLPFRLVALQTRDGDSNEIFLQNVSRYSNLLIVEDIIDSGRTLNILYHHNRLKTKMNFVVALFSYDEFLFDISYLDLYTPNVLKRKDPRWVVFPWEV